MSKEAEAVYENQAELIKACWRDVRKDNKLSGGNGVEIDIKEQS